MNLLDMLCYIECVIKSDVTLAMFSEDERKREVQTRYR